MAPALVVITVGAPEQGTAGVVEVVAVMVVTDQHGVTSRRRRSPVQARQLRRLAAHPTLLPGGSNVGSFRTAILASMTMVDPPMCATRIPSRRPAPGSRRG